MSNQAPPDQPLSRSAQQTGSASEPADPGTTTRRRTLMLAAAGLVAAAGGVGMAVWTKKDRPPLVEETVVGFWQLHWESPGTGEIRMEAFRGKPLLVNFWATWCPPCVEELPLINGYFNQNKSNGMQVVGIAVDKRSAVEPFLQRMPLAFPVALAGLGGAELSRSLGNLSGALPFSVLIGSGGEVLQRKLGRLTETDLQGWAQLK